jgi:hypothetical protein
MGRALLGAKLEDSSAVEALCREHGVEELDARVLARQFERLMVYRELVRSTLLDALNLSIPRTMQRLGALFSEYFDRFLAEQAPRSHYLRDVAPELLAWCRPLWRIDTRVPVYAADLGLHESLHIDVSALPAVPRPRAETPLALEHGVELSRALRLVEYDFAVHELPADPSDRSEPAERRVSLLVYRSPDHDVRYLELTPLARALLERLRAGAALGRALQEAAAELGASLDEPVLSGTAKLLSDLAERGVVLGALAAAAPEHQELSSAADCRLSSAAIEARPSGPRFTPEIP